MVAEESRKKLAESGRFKVPIVTPIRDASEFYLAEDYHQDYYKKHPLKYKYYRYRSGRDKFIDKNWGEERNYTPESASMQMTYTKPSAEQIKNKLTDLQYKVTQQEGTEPPFQNEYWQNTKPGIYVDIVSGEPLFSSCLLYTSPSPRDLSTSRMPSSA